jgi:4-hydroxy-3-polyprenylbenzoate decarboxylase
MRKNPIYFATVVGIPPMEDEWLGWATERLFLPPLRTNWPEVTQMHLPVEGVFHNLCLASIRKLYPMQARRLMSGFWGAGQMSFTKTVCVLEENDPVQDPVAALRVVLDRIRIPEDLVFSEGVLDALDHSSPHPLWGGKFGIDATVKIEGEPGAGELPPPSPPVEPEEVYSRLKPLFPGLAGCLQPVRSTRHGLCLLVLEKKNPGEGAAMAKKALEVEGVDIAVAVEGSSGEPLRVIAWRALSSVDPRRDITVAGKKLAIDATFKTGPEENHYREWPKEVSHPPEVIAKARGILEQ